MPRRVQLADHLTRGGTLKHLIIAVLLVLLAPLARAEHHVILITIDGLASYMLDDPLSPIPTIRRMAKEGTAAEGMRVSNPAVTWPNHTTLVTGVSPAKHSVLFNGVITRPDVGKPPVLKRELDMKDLVQVPTLFHLLHANKLRSAGVNWPCTRNSGLLEDDFSDVPTQVTHMTPRLKDEMIAQGWLKPDVTDATFRALSAAVKDQIWTATALHLIKARRPNFLAFHMLVTDGIQHKYGPQTPAAYTSVAQADAQMKDLLAALKEAGIDKDTTVIVLADHGFKSATKLVNPNVVFRKNGLVQTAALTIKNARAWSISEGGTALVYLNDPATKAADKAKVIELMKDHEGVADVIDAAVEHASLRMPDPAKNEQMADLILVAKDGYAFDNMAVGDLAVVSIVMNVHNVGHHGYISTDPRMNTLFVAWGRGVKRGHKIGTIDNVDVAPTIAKLLGLKMDSVDGRVITEMLE
jgi:predicted AlkP superfamily pyrophosphatase or phosphodiesterase